MSKDHSALADEKQFTQMVESLLKKVSSYRQTTDADRNSVDSSYRPGQFTSLAGGGSSLFSGKTAEQ
jgi:hypothetical protein